MIKTHALISLFSLSSQPSPPGLSPMVFFQFYKVNKFLIDEGVRGKEKDSINIRKNIEDFK
jgi:hypothetical protein